MTRNQPQLWIVDINEPQNSPLLWVDDINGPQNNVSTSHKNACFINEPQNVLKK